MSPTRNNAANFAYQETPNKNLYSLKDGVPPLPVKQTPRSPRRAMFGAIEQTPRESGEKRKDAPTSAMRNEQDAERAIKAARLSQGHSRQSSANATEHSRQSSATGHGHTLFGEIPKTVEEMDSSQGTIANSSFNDDEMNDASQLTTISVPDAQGPTSPARTSPPQTPETLRQNAQALKLRLQFAMYKLQTHQEHIPLSHVKVMAKQPRFPRVVSSPSLPSTRDGSSAASPVRSPPGPHSTGHSRNGSISKFANNVLAGIQHPNGQRMAVHEATGEETDEDDEKKDNRDTVSPMERQVARTRVEGYTDINPTAVMVTPERQDRLLSLVDAIESAEKQRGGQL